MSLKLHNFIEPQDFINLKNQVKEEIKRRKYKDLDKLYDLYASDDYDFQVSPTTNKEITYDDIQTILTPLKAIHPATVGVNISQGKSNINYSDFQKIQNALTVFSEGQRRENNTCNTNCVGMCVGCTDSCTSCDGCDGCSGCSGCGDGCTGCSGCGDACSSSCVAQCANGCGYCGGGW